MNDLLLLTTRREKRRYVHRDVRKTITTLVHIKKSSKLETVRIRIPTLAQSSSKLQSKWSDIHTISKFKGVVATITDPAMQSQTRVHVYRLRGCSPPLRDELEIRPSVSRSVSCSSLHGSMQEEPKRPVASVDPATQTRAPCKRVPKSKRRDYYLYLMYEYREMDMGPLNTVRWRNTKRDCERTRRSAGY